MMRDDDLGAKIRATREKELARKAIGGLASPFSCAVVGITFVPTYPNNLFQLEEANFNAEAMGERLTVVIVRNPDNPHDSNACQVHAPALGDDGMVGHLPGPVAARLAKELDTGVRWQGEISSIRVHQDHLDRPGLDITLKRAE